MGNFLFYKSFSREWMFRVFSRFDGVQAFLFWPTQDKMRTEPSVHFSINSELTIHESVFSKWYPYVIRLYVFYGTPRNPTRWKKRNSMFRNPDGYPFNTNDINHICIWHAICFLGQEHLKKLFFTSSINRRIYEEKVNKDSSRHHLCIVTHNHYVKPGVCR